MLARHVPMLTLATVLTSVGSFPSFVSAQDTSARAPVPATPRTLRFTTDEGTWMSLDLSPDGKTIVFDLLGDLYTLPIAGGTATRIADGPTWDSHPKFSPDGTHIAFVSDRTGAENLWIADADGKNPRAVTRGDRAWYVAPAWTPDGSAIIATRRNGLLVNDSELWMYPVDGGAGVKLTVPGRFAMERRSVVTNACCISPPSRARRVPRAKRRRRASFSISSSRWTARPDASRCAAGTSAGRSGRR